MSFILLREYAAALHKLDQGTDDDVRFHSVEVEVLHEPGAGPEPRFRAQAVGDRSQEGASVPSSRNPLVRTVPASAHPALCASAQSER